VMAEGAAVAGKVDAGAARKAEGAAVRANP